MSKSPISFLLPLAAALLTTAEAGPLKVFILAGQSNMQGHGRVEQGANGVSGGIGSLRYMVENDPENYGHLVDEAGNWKPREDVWIWSIVDNGQLGNHSVEKGELNVGYGVQDRIGPELGFGHIMGDLFEDQVLIIKTSWGGKSLAVDFRPFSSGAPGVGPYYRLMRDEVIRVLDNLETEFPEYDGQGYEIVGFGWHQGWNDRVNQDYVNQYETNLVNLIRDIRTGRGGFAVVDLPVVVAETGMTGLTETNTRALALMDAQEAPSDPTRYPQFAGTVGFVPTQAYWRDVSSSPVDQGYHWNGNGETYYLIGDGMGRRMARLLFDPEVRKVTREEDGSIIMTTNLPASEVTAQRSYSLDPESFADVPYIGHGQQVTIVGRNAGPGPNGSVFFRLVEKE